VAVTTLEMLYFVHVGSWVATTLIFVIAGAALGQVTKAV
jgi:hypothetical protein